MSDLRPTVGRTWYVKITEGTVGGRAELGTTHVATGAQVWDTLDLELAAQPLSERGVLDELYYALTCFMERRA